MRWSRLYFRLARLMEKLEKVGRNCLAQIAWTSSCDYSLLSYALLYFEIHSQIMRGISEITCLPGRIPYEKYRKIDKDTT